MRRSGPAACALAAIGFLLALHVQAADRAAPPGVVWIPRSAAAYLDGELDWWSAWPPAARDHGTFCVSCHTVAPYALARPSLAAALGEPAPSAPARKLFDNVATRVRRWNEVAPYYPDQTRGIPKTSESRGTESVLNALVLATRDAGRGTLGEDTRLAFAHMWALQMKTGDLDGAWAWLNFQYEPWESNDAPFFGAAMAVAALGSAPGDYAASPEATAGLDRLRRYIAGRFDRQNLFNRLTMVAAASRLADIVPRERIEASAAAAAALQQPDGGWSLSGFGSWSRADKTPLDTASDGYATALAVLALKRAGGAAREPVVARGLAWLAAHQQASGKWLATSLNKERDPASDPARFMNDAATAYAVLALTSP